MEILRSIGIACSGRAVPGVRLEMGAAQKKDSERCHQGNFVFEPETRGKLQCILYFAWGADSKWSKARVG